MEGFFAEQTRLIRTVGNKKRYLYDTIDRDLRCIGILGARGTGKTTLMLQMVKEHSAGGNDRALYVSIDSPYFQAHDLFEFARTFHQHGGEVLFIDEVHKYPDWSVHIKSIYDGLPGLRVVFTGSSLLKIAKQKGDLSRRAVIYHLHGMSFREYINFTRHTAFPPFSLEDILKDHQVLATDICRDLKILRFFKQYLQSGYYPFFLEGENYYRLRLREVINHILEVDLPYISGIEIRQIAKIKKLLYMLAITLQFAPNIVKLSEATEISRPKLYEYLEHLQDAKLLNLLRRRGRGYAILTKPDKIYLENGNLMYAITEDMNAGTLRELFFVNQLRNAFSNHPALIDATVELTDRGDFYVKSVYTFEIGGKAETYDQIKDISNSFIAADDIETGFGNKIPLWLFGFLY
ncbi:MAG: AAA family ATPase [Syntrophaceae bacterium CG2_30_49_12]|nr:MAG: AAA family ATPase [Syntrophaceae bacterium CG2_30_49_12]